MKQRTLGANGPKIGEIGLGCMSFAGAGASSPASSSAGISRHACLKFYDLARPLKAFILQFKTPNW